MQFRKASAADAAELAPLNRELIEDEGHRNRMTLGELEGRMRNWLENEYQAIIFEQDCVVVAYALYRHDPNSIYLRHFFVLPTHRRQGIGRQAIQILLSQVWPPGRRVTLEVLVNNQRAYKFWQAVGFKDYAITMEILPEKQ